MARTFTNGGYSVTVHDDRSIRVRPGDWISKYAAAIYGDPHAHWDRFKKKVGGAYVALDDPDRIDAGMILYHPDPLPGEAAPPPPAGGAPGGGPPLRSRYAADFLEWVLGRFVRTDWAVTGTAGGDLSLSFWTAQYAQIAITKASVAVETWFHALASGLTLGFPSEGFTAGGSFSTVHFPSGGAILRAPWRRELALHDFRHGFVSLEFGANFVYGVGGGSAALLLFGIAAPIVVFREIGRFFRHGNISALRDAFNRASPSGVALLGGGTLGIPGGSVAGRLGFMYDKGIFRR